MKKVNAIFYVVGIVCFVVAIYIIYDKFFANKEIIINFNEDEEIVLLNDKLSEIGSSLGWIVIVDGINNQDDNGNYVVTYDKDLLDNIDYRQLFVMEYILSNVNNYDLFTVYDTEGNKVDDIPTSEMTMAYIKYDDFNSYYKDLFGENFNINTSSVNYEKVYYDNRRAGSNGVYVSMIQGNSIEYNDGIYKANVNVTYSTRASELIGTSEDTAMIEYTKDINGSILLRSFTLKDR